MKFDGWNEIRTLATEKRNTEYDNLKFLQNLTNPSDNELSRRRTSQLIVNQSSLDINVVNANLYAIRYDEQELKKRPGDRNDIEERIAYLVDDTHERINRLEHWLYPYSNFVDQDQQDDALLFLQSPQRQRHLQAAAKPIPG